MSVVDSSSQQSQVVFEAVKLTQTQTRVVSSPLQRGGTLLKSQQGSPGESTADPSAVAVPGEYSSATEGTQLVEPLQIEAHGAAKSHPYFQRMWQRLSREGQRLSEGEDSGMLRIMVAIHLEKSGVVSQVELNVESGQISQSQLQRKERILRSIRRLDPIPDEISLRPIKVVYRLQFTKL